MKVSQIPYKRVELDEITALLGKAIEDFKASTTAEQQLKLYFDLNEQLLDMSAMMSIAHIRYSQDTRDEFYLGEQQELIKMGPHIRKLATEFDDLLRNSPFREQLQKTIPPLVFQKLDYSARTFSPEIMAELQTESQIGLEYSQLMSNAKIKFRGEVYNLSQMGKFTQSSDRPTRIEAFNANGEWLESVSDQLDDIFDRLVKVRTTIAHKLGFESFVELGLYRMKRFGYGIAELDAYREQVKNDLLPVVVKLKQKQAQTLGVDKITIVDSATKFANGNPTPIGTPEQIFENGSKMYHAMSQITGEFFDYMLEHDCFDVLAREGKSGGGYCATIDKYKLPFIFANFNGTSGDIDVLTHEAGHALNAYINSGCRFPELKHTTMETAEVHSMSMEFFAHKYMDLFFGDRADDYRYMHLFDGLDFIPYGTTVHYFQQLVYSNPTWTPAERNACWVRLVEEYCPYLNADQITYLKKGTRWQTQGHIFSAPFYYIDYCLAQTVALQFYVQLNHDYDRAWKMYIDFIDKCLELPFPEAVQACGLTSPFEQGTLKSIAQTISKILL